MTMQTITAYHRPQGTDEALQLLTREGIATVIVGGGTVVTTTELAPGTEVIDIQDAVPATFDSSADRLTVGAMARLQDLIDHEATPRLLAELAQREGPSTFRNAATVGGTIAAADPESELVAGLIVHDAVVAVATEAGSTEVAIADLLADPAQLDGAIITSVSVATDGETASARTGRTPADTSIVAAAGRVVPDGITMALTGVAATPIVVDPDSLGDLAPPADFRGSTQYRRELAAVLTRRVVEQLGGSS